MTNYTSFDALLQVANTATGGMYGNLFPFLVFLIGMGASSVFGWNTAFTVGAFMGFAVMLPMFAMGITSGYVGVVLGVMFLIGAFFLTRQPSMR
jgi:hypothetical protein